MFDSPPQQPQPNQGPYSYGAGSQGQPQLRAKRHTMKKVLIVVGILGAAALGVTLFVITNRATTNICLNSADYLSLTGSRLDSELSPRSNFYTTYVSFLPNTVTYDTSDTDHGAQLIERVASFYSTHDSSSIRIEISGTYYDSSASYQSLAQQRIDSVRGALVAKGIPMRLISADSPSYTAPEDEDTDSNNTITITIISASDCR